MSQKKTDDKQKEEIINEVDNQTKNTETEKQQADSREQQPSQEQTVQRQPEEERDDDKRDDDKRDEELAEIKDRFRRLAAEFDNYKKRTLKEKEKLYCGAAADVVASFLPVLDNVERAVTAADDPDGQNIREGVQLIHRQMQDILTNMGVRQIDALGKTFDPDFHEAVLHVSDEKYGENEIIEEFQKGYIYKDEIVIRHSVVKVAN